MPIHTVIHEKRKELGLTQEQIASYLGVTAPAVNKWERGNTYPDITLLPALARLLKVDLNTLMCFQEELTVQEIQNMGGEAARLAKTEGLDAAFRMMNEKIREYPHCVELIHDFALIADSSLIMAGLTAEEKKNYEDQILSWYRRVADNSAADKDKKASAVYMLASKYMSREDFDKAQEMIDLLPEYNALDKRTVQANLYLFRKAEGDIPKALELMQRKLLNMAVEISGILERMVQAELSAGHTDRAVKLSEKAENTVKALEMWDYYSYIAPLDIAIEQKNVPECVRLIEALLSSALSPWKMKDSLLYDRVGAHVDMQAASASILQPLIAMLEKAPEYAFLREDESFRRMVETYKIKFSART